MASFSRGCFYFTHPKKCPKSVWSLNIWNVIEFAWMKKVVKLRWILKVVWLELRLELFQNTWRICCHQLPSLTVSLVNLLIDKSQMSTFLVVRNRMPLNSWGTLIGKNRWLLFIFPNLKLWFSNLSCMFFNPNNFFQFEI